MPRKKSKPVTQEQIAALVQLVNSNFKITNNLCAGKAWVEELTNILDGDIKGVRAVVACLAKKKDLLDDQVREAREWLNDDRRRVAEIHKRVDDLEAVAHPPLGQDAIYDRLDKLEEAICPRVAARLTALERVQKTSTDSLVRGAVLDVKLEERIASLERRLDLRTEYAPDTLPMSKWRVDSFRRLFEDMRADANGGSGKTTTTWDKPTDKGWEPDASDAIKRDRADLGYHRVVLKAARKLNSKQQRDLICTLVSDWLGD